MEERANPSGDAEAEKVYEEFLRRRARGEVVDIEGLCADHPELSNWIRLLDSLSRNPVISASGTGTRRRTNRRAQGSGGCRQFTLRGGGDGP